jgi:hypothetical protein
MGNSESPAAYLGRALLLADRRDEATRVLAVEVRCGGDAAALTPARRSRSRGSDAGFDAYLESRPDGARADDSAADYEGMPHTFAQPATAR